MPATETTWRDLKLMHVIFGVSSLLMLAATIWMLADDHNRPWKQYQRQFQNVEYWTAQSRIDEEMTEQFLAKRNEIAQELDQARRQPLDTNRVQQFLAESKLVAGDDSEVADLEAAIDAYQSASSSDYNARLERREAVLEAMRTLIARRRFRENNLATEVKVGRAELDKARADYDMAVGKGRPDDEIGKLKEDFDRIRVRLEGDTAGIENGDGNVRSGDRLRNGRPQAGLVGQLQAAKLHREELEGIYKEISAAEDAAKKNLADHNTKLDQLHVALLEREPRIGKDALTMPVLDAFGSPLKIDQIWLPQLTLNNNFRDVARFDRCATCHQAMDKTQPGAPSDPGYRPEHRISLDLQSPTRNDKDALLAEVAAKHERDDREADEQGLEKKSEHDRTNDKLRALYGLKLAERGLLKENDVTISVALPETSAAQAGLMASDVIEELDGAKMLSLAAAEEALLDRFDEDWGQPIRLVVRRGMPHPYSSHPRLDLFVGSMSPHPMGKFGCTICHQGQGSATSFDWASHTPDNLTTAREWAQDYGWFNNHHWIFPMYSKRFAESSCLKCHHQVTELGPSRERPEGAAPKLMKGYQLILDYGCYGCHEINGFDGPTKRIGPDLRNEPNVFAAAAQLLADPGLGELGDDAVALARQLVQSPEDSAARRRLHELVQSDIMQAEERAKAQAKNGKLAADVPKPVLSATSHKMEALLRDIDAPGDLRKVGPSLRHVAAKNSFEFLFDWIEDPHRFRPSTKMPRFFGLHDHLDGEGLEVAKEFEPIEVRAMAEQLLAASQPFEYLEPADGAEGSAERGKKVFEMRGCLACHSHSDFPAGKATHGPDLSRIGAKLSTSAGGKKWLYSWVREPNRYHSRTVMPNTFLEPVTDSEGNTTDPALDVTEYLMTSQEVWQAREVNRQMTSAELAALERLALLHLEDKFPKSRAEQFLQSGIPASQAGEIKGDEEALFGLTAENRIAKITGYVGRRSISKYGCFGCHDIPGYEDAKPIGTGLADWGRKEPSRLAFENIMQYLHNGHPTHAKQPHGNHEHAPSANATAADESLNGEAIKSIPDYAEHPPFAPEKVEPLEAEYEADREFFEEKIASHEREGFIWQKLHDPRSYDFKKTENKKYNERLRMPKFYFSQDRQENEEAIEAIMTFVLGLVSEPPAAQYIFNAPAETQALISGRKLLDKFNCGGCHVLEADRWEIEYLPGWAEQDAELPEKKDRFTGPEPEFNDYEFLRPHFTPAQRAAATMPDRRNRLRATIIGSPVRDHTDGSLKRWDDEGTPLEAGDPTPGNYDFTLYQPALINGVLWPVGGPNMRIQPSMLARTNAGSPEAKVYPGRGGDLARLLFPAVVKDNPTYNSDAKAQEAWGWLPPPLIGEGRKVQTGWLHDFLLDPHPIRPPAVLRMPKFNMSSAEAQALANYFAAVDGATYPYEFESRTRSGYLAEVEAQHPNHLSDALKIITDNNYCVKCHLVGDFEPGGDPKALAPQMERIHERLRPDFVRGWVANPKRFLPYTGMPVNIPHNMPVDQKLYPGTSEQQLNGVVDLLMNFDQFTKRKFSVKPLIKPAAPTPTAPSSAAPAATTGAATSGNEASATRRKSSQ